MYITRVVYLKGEQICCSTWVLQRQLLYLESGANRNFDAIFSFHSKRLFQLVCIYFCKVLWHNQIYYLAIFYDNSCNFYRFFSLSFKALQWLNWLLLCLFVCFFFILGPYSETNLRSHILMISPIGHIVLLLEFQLRYLKKLKLFSIWIKELFEPVVSRKIRRRIFALFKKHFLEIPIVE